MAEQVSLLIVFSVAFVAGLASLAGPEIFGAKTKRRRLAKFPHSLSFVIGFSIVNSGGDFAKPTNGEARGG